MGQSHKIGQSDEEMNGFIKFDECDHWVHLANEIFEALNIEMNETRLSSNLSPLLEEYCKGNTDGEIIRLIPLFSNEMKPGIIILPESEERFENELAQRLEVIFGERFLMEDSEFDWPDNGKEILESFNQTSKNLKNNRISG